MNTLNNRWLLAPVMLLAVAAAAPPYAQATAAEQLTTKVAQTNNAMRDLWLGHVFWVRNVVVETLAGNAAAAAVAENEVVANAKRISAAIEPFYGKAASDKLFGLLAGHYGAVKSYLEATAASSQAKQDDASKTMADNVGEIAVFLGGANPNLPVETLRSLLLAHVGHHVQAIQQLSDKHYDQEAATWEAMKNHIYGVADALTGAIAKQFPAKF